MSGDALRVAREKAVGLVPAAAAARIGAVWDEGTSRFRLPFLSSRASVTHPAFEVSIGERPAPPHIAALILYHLALSDGARPTGTWISFADLPDASFYVTAFRGYTSAQIIRRFAPDGERMDEAVERIGGKDLPGLADRAWLIPALPRVPVALLWWDADDEFDARAELLFDSTASHHLTTDGCAVLGSWLTSLLTRRPLVPPEHAAPVSRP
ncbi:MAG: DUF3786 domain-containing protein [Coriobacteriia bacterium]|nr:DUF3786 domain-containing protein [Coriobacteriia bacterium]